MKLKHKSLGVFKTINLSGWEGFVLQDFDNLIPGWFKTFVQVGNDLIWSQYLIGLLLTAGFFFTISSKFIQLRMLPEMFRALTEKPETLSSGEKGICLLYTSDAADE